MSWGLLGGWGGSGGGGSELSFFPTASLAVVPNYPGSWRISDRAPPINADKFSKVSSLQAALI